MKILHLCLSCFFIDGLGYQENELVRQHMKDGHDVTVVASTETFSESMKLCYVQPADYIGKEGCRVVRLPYSRWLPHVIMRKLRIHPGLYDLVTALAPECIVFHGLCGWELQTVAKYKSLNPHVRVVADSHEDRFNSARGLISRYLLHQLYYRWVIHRSLKGLDGIYCVSIDTMNFVNKTYGLDWGCLKFFPLGAVVYEDSEYKDIRSRIRSELGVTDRQIIFLQTGKMGIRKKLLESLDAFTANSDANFVYLLAGSIEQDIFGRVSDRMAMDDRIRNLGWISTERLKDILCAADVYMQPGSQSATMQMSLGARCAVVLDDVVSHYPFVQGNGWLISSSDELGAIVGWISKNSREVEAMCFRSAAIAKTYLDYRMLASELLS